jgi:Protein of unknown function (DUF1203)
MEEVCCDDRFSLAAASRSGQNLSMMKTRPHNLYATAVESSPGPVQRRYDPQAIEAAALSELRRRDDAGRSMQAFVAAHSDAPVDAAGSPLRCCLRAARAGERVALVSYAPLRRWAATMAVDPGAYDEIGPVFIHADPCSGPSSSGEMTGYPHARPGAMRTLRKYDRRGFIVGGDLLEIPSDTTAGFNSALDGAFANPDVALVHVRALEYGCFQFSVERP